ncbi:MAG TPA: TIGR03032 family protein [Urbifossiella sp.]|nr:TIGR03032 family protein [Urbifossiella sp.]
MAEDQDAAEKPRTGEGSPAAPEKTRDIHFAYSENMPALFKELNCSLLISTYLIGNVVAISNEANRLTASFHLFDRPMGMAVSESRIAVGTRMQVWFLRSSPDIAAKIQARGKHDACYIARYSQNTGDLSCHEIGWVGNELWIVNTRFSCLCALHPYYHFAPRWRPRFITKLAPEDRCHLNGLALADGRARYVSAMAETDTVVGWRAQKTTGGCLIDVSTGETVVRGLTMPHSPRLMNGQLYVLHSGLGRLERVDPSNGQRDVVCEFPGYVRGLAFRGSIAFVGLSKVRVTSSWDGVPIAAHPERLKCGIWVVDLAKGSIIGHIEFSSGVDELFDVQILPNISLPLISGPLAEMDSDSPFWSVAPPA